MEGTQRKGSHDEVGIVYRVYIKVAIIDPSSEHRSRLRDNDDAIPIFDNISQRYDFGRATLKDQTLEKTEVEPRSERNGHEGHNYCADSPGRHSYSFAGFESKQECNAPGQHCAGS